MKNRKSILLLLLGIAAVASLDFSVYFGKSRQSSAVRISLIDPSDAITRVRIERKDAPETVLECESGRWSIARPYAGSVDERVVMRLVDGLSVCPIQDAISSAELLALGRMHADFGLDDPVLSVAVVADGREEVLRFGGRTPTSDGIYVSVDGFDGVFVVSSNVLTVADVPASGFRRRSLFSETVDAPTSLVIRKGVGQTLEIVRDESGWKISGERAAGMNASAQKVDKMVKELASAEAVGFVWPTGASNETAHVSASILAGYGLDPDSAVAVTVRDGDGVSRRILFGKEADANLVYALIQDGTAVVTVPSALRDAVTQDAVRLTDSRLFPFDARVVSLFSLAAENALYALAKEKDGSWRIESPIAAPAEKANVEFVLSRILSLSASDVTQDERGVGVSVATNTEKTVVLRESVLGSLRFEDLRSKEMVRLDPALVKRIVRLSGDKADSLIYDRERRSWNVENGAEGASASEIGLKSVLSTLTSLVAARVEKLQVPATALDDYGLGKPFLTVAVDLNTEDSVRRNILVGKKTKGGRFATVGSSDAVFVLSEAAVRSLSAPIVVK